jgi:hypothetical protein
MRRFIAPVAVLSAVLMVAGSALAEKPPWAGGGSKQGGGKPTVTKMRFKLADHSVAEGEEVTGSVLVTTGRGRAREPLEDAELTVLVDHVQVGTLTTGPEGRADVAYGGGAAGEHVMKLVYAGDEDHKRSRRAQGFEVGGATEEGLPE